MQQLCCAWGATRRGPNVAQWYDFWTTLRKLGVAHKGCSLHSIFGLGIPPGVTSGDLSIEHNWTFKRSIHMFQNMYQPSSLSPVKFSTSPFAQASWHLSYSASTFVMSDSRLFTHLQFRIEGNSALWSGKRIRTGSCKTQKLVKWNIITAKYAESKLNRETHLWQLRCSFSSNHGPMIGVSQASKSCWGGTSSKFLWSDRGMRNRPFKS